jgi:UDP-glucose 6-dehydrogenase
MICIFGDTFAPDIFRRAAQIKGLELCWNVQEADLVMICKDTPTNEHGNRDLDCIRDLVTTIYKRTKAVIVLTSQVPPGFTRSLQLPIWCQAETLRVKDALERALHPEQHIVGCQDPRAPLPSAYLNYLDAFPAPIFKMSYESCEYSKIAINMTLASQVENTNRLYEAAKLCKAEWKDISKVLSHDGRIGHRSYLTPGDWKKSPHLLRDWVTIKGIL